MQSHIVRHIFLLHLFVRSKICTVAGTTSVYCKRAVPLVRILITGCLSRLSRKLANTDQMTFNNRCAMVQWKEKKRNSYLPTYSLNTYLYEPESVQQVEPPPLIVNDLSDSSPQYLKRVNTGTQIVQYSEGYCTMCNCKKKKKRRVCLYLYLFVRTCRRTLAGATSVYCKQPVLLVRTLINGCLRRLGRKRLHTGTMTIKRRKTSVSKKARKKKDFFSY